MKHYLVILPFVFTSILASAQLPDSVSTPVEQQLENLTENNEDVETEDDSYLQELRHFQNNPLELNSADESSLKDFKLLTPAQIQNFISYRKYLGNLINLYELQAIPTWDLLTITKIRAYVTVSNDIPFRTTLLQRLKGGKHTLLIRGTQVIEKSRGYLLDSAIANNYYLGSPQRIMVRYKYNFKNVLQYGLLGEKDPGEQFLKGVQSKGFDFYSAHLFVKNMGLIKGLAIGDYTVNLGQGLVQWQSLAFKKGGDVLNLKRQSAVLKPYSSSGEINFHRGVALTAGKRNWESTLFASFRNVDANFIRDSSNYLDEYVSSLQVSGYHRTMSEAADRSIQRQLSFGGNFTYTLNSLQLGLNGIQYFFKFPLQRTEAAHHLLALSGKSFGNYSFDYGYTLRNMHLFGEVAITNSRHLAVVNGLLISTAANIDLSILHRKISPAYQSLYTSAFTENTLPTNENGLFAGISIRAGPYWQFIAYFDIYRFPGLKFRVHGPSAGSDNLLQVQYKPNKQLEIYSRYKRESKGINFNPNESALSPVINQVRQNWRTHLSYRISSSVTLRNRVELVWFDKKAVSSEEGYLICQDVLYKPQLRKFTGNVRFMYFETGGYNSRIYAFENDVLYSYSIPVFYDKGYRYYVNLNYNFFRNLEGWLKLSRTYYPEKKSVGSGLDEISADHKTEIRVQLLYHF